MIDLLAVVLVMAVVVGEATPAVMTGLDDARARAAARWLVGRMQRARVEALRRSASVGLHFADRSDGYRMAVYLDGNGNGLLADELRSGVDPALGTNEHLADQFPGVAFGVLPALPAIESGSEAPGTDAIHFGAGRTVSFSTDGSATPGSAYILSARGRQYAVRVAGETGRIRVWRFDARLRRWSPL